MRFLTPIFAAFAMVAMFTAPPAYAQRNQGGSVVVLNYENMVTSSDIGRDMTTKLGQIQQQMQGELRPEAQAIQQEQQAIQQATNGMTQQQVRNNSGLNTRVEAFQQRVQTFQQRSVTSERDFEYTRQMALNEFNRQTQQSIQEAMQAKGAAVVVDAAVTRFAASGADITDDVVQRLNQRVRTINVTRQTAPAPQQQAGGGQ